MTREVLPKSVRAAIAFDGGTDIEIIAAEYGWTKRAAYVAVARGRNWAAFLRKNRAGNRHRNAKAAADKRRQEIQGDLDALVAEAARLGVAVEVGGRT